jgi:hypothetical protein
MNRKVSHFKVADNHFIIKSVTPLSLTYFSKCVYVVHVSLLIKVCGKFSLKYAVVKPLFKKGERSCISNYRPTSLLTSLSKVFEKVIYNRLLEHTNSNNILVKEQFGFRKK